MLSKILLAFTIVCNFATLVGLWIAYEASPATLQGKIGHVLLFCGATFSIVAYITFAIFVWKPKVAAAKDATVKDPTDWKTLYLDANVARTEYQTKYADVANRLQQLEKTLKPPLPHPIPQLRLKILETCVELQAFLGTHGDRVKTTKHPEETRDQHLLRLSSPELKEARVKYVGDYCLRHRQTVLRLRDEIRQRCGISDPELDQAIILAEDDLSGRAADDLERVIHKFWEVAERVNV